MAMVVAAASAEVVDIERGKAAVAVVLVVEGERGRRVDASARSAHSVTLTGKPY